MSGMQNEKREGDQIDGGLTQAMIFRRWPLSSALALFLAAATTQPVSAIPVDGAWTISKTVSPLTDATSVSAQLASVETLNNMLDQPAKATLVLRCSDGVISAYVAWPQVLDRQTSSAFLNTPQTMALTRIDGGQIKADYWTISSDGTAAGAFDTKSATKLLTSFERAKKLVVRLTGTVPQDASFDLTGIESAASQVRSTCGAPAAASPPEAKFGPPIQLSLTGSTTAAFAVARRALEADGFQIDRSDPQTGMLVTSAKPVKLTTKDADCGKAIGLPYLIDYRASTSATVRLSKAGGGYVAEVKIDGVFNVTPPKALTCMSKGVIEADIAQRINAASIEPEPRPLP